MEAIFAAVRKIGGLNLDKSKLHLICSYRGIFFLETATRPRREAEEVPENGCERWEIFFSEG